MCIECASALPLITRHDAVSPARIDNRSVYGQDLPLIEETFLPNTAGSGSHSPNTNTRSSATLPGGSTMNAPESWVSSVSRLMIGALAVSYTHLTLPTSDLV